MIRLLLAIIVGSLAACATVPESGGSATPVVTSFGFTVEDLDRATGFFVDTLGAQVVERRQAEGPELDALTGLDGARAEAVILAVGDERVVLTDYASAGRRLPSDAVSNDLDFQHLALVVRQMDEAYRKVVDAGAQEVSQGGPQRIPDSNVAAAGIRAFYFRDREAHPLELIWFPSDKGAARWHADRGPLVLGIDHSAIAVRSTEASLVFYQGLLGLKIAGKSLNEGTEQERLSGVSGARVRITGLRGDAGPGVEFLQYEAPGPGRPRPSGSSVRDFFHWETTIVVDDLDAMAAKLSAAKVELVSKRAAECGLCVVGRRALLVRDPDGHVVRLVER